MPAPNVFESDIFDMTTMTAAQNNMASVPAQIANMGLFREEGITTTSVWMELQKGKLQLVKNQERGMPGQNLNREKRRAIPFKVMHLPQQEFLMADQVQNVRAFGTENVMETVEALRDKKLQRMRNNLDTTIEYHRVGAIQGKILDADGTVIDDLFDAFGLIKEQVDFGLKTDGKGDNDFRNKTRVLKRKSRKALGAGVFVTRWRMLCGVEWYSKFIAHEANKAAWDRYNESEMLRSDHQAAFTQFGVAFEEYDAEVNDKYLVSEDKAFLIPEGVQDLFVTSFAPAPWLSTVNTMGLPYYANAQPKDDKYIEIESQSNPFQMCSVPNAVIELDF